MISENHDDQRRYGDAASTDSADQGEMGWPDCSMSRSMLFMIRRLISCTSSLASFFATGIRVGGEQSCTPMFAHMNLCARVCCLLWLCQLDGPWLCGATQSHARSLGLTAPEMPNKPYAQLHSSQQPASRPPCSPAGFLAPGGASGPPAGCCTHNILAFGLVRQFATCLRYTKWLGRSPRRPAAFGFPSGVTHQRVCGRLFMLWHTIPVTDM